VLTFGRGVRMKGKITKKSVDALIADVRASGTATFLWDSELAGFGAKVTAGACSYVIQYRLGGRNSPTRRLTLGKHGVLTPDEARRAAKEKLAEVAKGSDVAQAKKASREKLTGLTFAEAAQRLLDMPSSGTERYSRTKRARLLNSPDVQPIAGKPIALITRADVAAVIDAATIRSPSAALVLHSHIRTVFAWALSRSLIEADPSFGVPAPAKPKARDRVLSDEEIKAFWQAASELNWPFSSVFKVLLLTGQRREEVSGLRWREVDLDAGQWTIAKERCKNGKAHTVDLHPEAIALLDPIGDDAAPRLMKDTKSDLIYSTTGRTPVSGFSKVKARIDTRMQAILGDKFQPWHTHDLRRTAASGMAALVFQPHIIERVLNHVSGAQGGLVSVYQRHEYRQERKAAIMAWGDHLMQLVRGEKAASNVVRLRVA
jgi:integrase